MNRRGPSLGRRRFVQGMGAGALAAGLLCALAQGAEEKQAVPKGRIQQAICRGVLRKMPFEKICQVAAELGLKGIDLVRPEDWSTLKKHGLICTMVPCHGLTKGLNRKENHSECLAAIRKSIEAAAEAGYPNVICFSGNRNGLDDATGLANCVEGLKQVASLAEQKRVTLCMELLNSKRNHKDYQCDRTAWGAEMCKKVGSERVKLLYDIYHMQVQEGDVIATIREHIEWIGHFHTAGVPGRHEIDQSQELYYPAIIRAIAELKYDGYLAHEYSPQGEPLAALKKAIALCSM